MIGRLGIEVLRDVPHGDRGHETDVPPRQKRTQNIPHEHAVDQRVEHAGVVGGTLLDALGTLEKSAAAFEIAAPEHHVDLEARKPAQHVDELDTERRHRLFVDEVPRAGLLERLTRNLEQNPFIPHTTSLPSHCEWI